MTPLGTGDRREEKAAAAAPAAVPMKEAVTEPVDFSKVEIEPLFQARKLIPTLKPLDPDKKPETPEY